MRLAQLSQKKTFAEPVWHVLLAIVVVMCLQLILNDALTFGIKYVIVGLEALLLLSLSVLPLAPVARRLFAISLMALISVVNILSLVMVINMLFSGVDIEGRALLISSVAIYITNIVVFGLWYWELDNTKVEVDDFQFPKSGTKEGNKPWRPTFFDYLYVSVTNATSFSPSDTVPLTHRAKLLMLIQSLASLIAVALVAARAINILS